MHGNEFSKQLLRASPPGTLTSYMNLPSTVFINLPHPRHELLGKKKQNQKHSHFLLLEVLLFFCVFLIFLLFLFFFPPFYRAYGANCHFRLLIDFGDIWHTVTAFASLVFAVYAC